MIDLSQFPMHKKPYSDGTLKQWSKSELIEYIRLIEGNYKTLYQVYIQSVKNAEELLGRKKGRWMESETDGFICSVCRNGYKNQPTCMGKPMFEFCPVCGAKMEQQE